MKTNEETPQLGICRESITPHTINSHPNLVGFCEGTWTLIKSLCNKPAGSVNPNLGLCFACVLTKDHEGACKSGGTCVKHGAYINWPCPKCEQELYEADAKMKELIFGSTQDDDNSKKSLIFRHDNDKDARRYRWLRYHLEYIDFNPAPELTLTCDTCDVGLDYAIDKAIEKNEPGPSTVILSRSKGVIVKESSKELPKQRIRVQGWDGVMSDDVFYGYGEGSDKICWRHTVTEAPCSYPITHWTPLFDFNTALKGK